MSEKIGLFLCCMPPSELRTGDGSGNSDVETLGTLAMVEIGDEQPVGDPLAYGLRNAITLIAHDDDTFLGECLPVDVAAIEQGAIDRVGWGERLEELQQVAINNMYVRKTAHRGLHHLGIIGIGCILAAIDGVNANTTLGL